MPSEYVVVASEYVVVPSEYVVETDVGTFVIAMSEVERQRVVTSVVETSKSS